MFDNSIVEYINSVTKTRTSLVKCTNCSPNSKKVNTKQVEKIDYGKKTKTNPPKLSKRKLLLVKLRIIKKPVIKKTSKKKKSVGHVKNKFIVKILTPIAIFTILMLYLYCLALNFTKIL